MGIPVKVYRSSDTNAPQITGGRGDVKTVLKACLVTGFGDKTALGWEVVPGTESEDGFDAAFRPTDINSARNIIHVAGTNTQSVTLTAYFDTDVEGHLVDASAAMLRCPTWISGTHQWVLIGHGKSFVFFSRAMSVIQGDAAGAQARGFFFGQLENRINNPRGNTLLLRLGGIGEIFSLNAGASSETAFLSGAYSRLSHSHDGLNKWVQCTFSNGLGELGGVSALNEYYCSKVPIAQGGVYRGCLPFYFVHHKITSAESFQTVQLNQANYLMVRNGDGNSINGNGYFRPWLINLEEWEF